MALACSALATATFLWVAAAPSASAAAVREVGTVVLHVVDHQHVADEEWAGAQKAASDAYARIGVRLLWTSGSARLATADHRVHLDVAVLDEGLSAVDGSEPSAFGKASHAMGRATIYYPRIRAHAVATGSPVPRLLGLVLAHELGHLLLPEGTHSDAGLMRARWHGRIQFIPGLLPEQAAIIQARVRLP